MKNIYKWLILSLIIVLITSNKETFVNYPDKITDSIDIVKYENINKSILENKRVYTPRGYNTINDIYPLYPDDVNCSLLHDYSLQDIQDIQGERVKAITKNLHNLIGSKDIYTIRRELNKHKKDKEDIGSTWNDLKKWYDYLIQDEVAVQHGAIKSRMSTLTPTPIKDRGLASTQRPRPSPYVDIEYIPRSVGPGLRSAVPYYNEAARIAAEKEAARLRAGSARIS